jgi:hypothetical protein
MILQGKYTLTFLTYIIKDKTADISKKLISENQELLNSQNDCHDFWFALALAQWETKSLDPIILENVKSIIKSGKDIELWKELNSDENDIGRHSIQRKVLKIFPPHILKNNFSLPTLAHLGFAPSHNPIHRQTPKEPITHRTKMIFVTFSSFLKKTCRYK